MNLSRYFVNKILIVNILSFISVSIYAQNNSLNDTTSMPMGNESAKNYVPVYNYLHNVWFPEILNHSLVDTSINEIQRTEILSASRNLYAHLGLIGQANYSMNFTFQRKHGFVYKSMPFSLYHRNFNNWHWHYTPESYTRVDYEWGSGKENLFNVTHVQSIKNFEFEIDFSTMIAEGIYVRQAIRDVNVGARLSYRTTNKRYGFHFAYLYNLFRLNENGGIAQDTMFETGMSARSIEVKLSDASSDYQDHDLFFRHYFRLLKFMSDTNNNKFSLGYIIHDLEYSQFKSLYKDNALNIDYYNLFNYDSLQTFDSVKSFQFRNSLVWSNFLNEDSINVHKDNFLHLVFGISHSYIKVGDSSDNFYNFQLTPMGKAHVRLFKYLDLKIDFLYTLNGYNSNDITSTASFSWKVKDKHLLSLKSAFYRYQPDYFYTYYLANTYQWSNNNLKKQQHIQLGIEWQYDNYVVNINYYSLQNSTMLKEDISVFQLNRAANIIQFAAWVPFRYKGFGFDANVYLQYCDNSSLQMPWLATRESVFYGFTMFKKALFLQLGFEMLYNTPYYAYGYNPVMQQFYFQDEKKIGNYFYLDFFANVKVSRFYFHFVLGNFLADVFPKTYYLVPHYPAKGLHFRVGASWRFHD
ncbi:MAG: hypothetical protein PHI52_00090 [Bacteroidales bacterium]|nr:hypothetical protein [Bacteroidales bacterium]